MAVAPVPQPHFGPDAVAPPASEALAAFLRRAPRQSGDRATPAAAFDAARSRYLTGERIDMQALAAQIGVSRPTLYRWTGGREQLISDVLFSFSDESLVRAARRTTHLSGPERLIACFRDYVEALVAAAPLQMFLQQETQAALRILTSRTSSVQIRTVARVAELYREEARSGAFVPSTDIDTLAYAVVKVTEAFIYNDAIVAVEPEVDRAAAIVALLIGSGAPPAYAPAHADPTVPEGTHRP
jgi:AcrR family transcriptional regulator